MQSKQLENLENNNMANTQTTGKCICNRLPLTDEQIKGCVKGMFRSGDPWLAFARAIEAAHGIKGEE